MSSCSEHTDKQYVQEFTQWQENRIKRLKSESGWLNLAGLYWLAEGENTIGSDSSNSILFPESAPDFCGSIVKNKDEIKYYVHPGSEIYINSEILTEAKLEPDITQNPSICKTGSFEWFIIKRDDLYGIRLRDFENPRIDQLKEIPSFPVEKRWIKKAKFEAFHDPDSIEVATMVGGTETYEVPGKIIFRHKGKKYELFPFRSGKGFFIILGDKTSAIETYAAGRYMYTDAPDENNELILDFNKAYNPPCAFSPFATCPLPPPENRLDLAITAGEKAVHLD